MWEFAYDDAETAIVEEFEDSEEVTLNGIVEYGVGFWSRFLWNGLKAKIVDKPAWLGFVRLSSNRDFKDAQLPGDRLLSCMVGRGYYHFSTYHLDEPSVYQNVDYGQNLDGEWIYIHFGYKRSAEKEGNAKGFVMFSGDNVRETKFDNIIHKPLNNYLYLGIGTSGVKRYPLFNGQITKFQLFLNDKGYLAKPEDLRVFMENKPTPKKIDYDVDKDIIEGTERFISTEAEPNLIAFEEEFAGA